MDTVGWLKILTDRQNLTCIRPGYKSNSLLSFSISNAFHLLPAVSEVSGSLQPDMALFCSGDCDEEEKLSGPKVQSLDSLLDRSPTHPPRYIPRKEFSGEKLCQLWG